MESAGLPVERSDLIAKGLPLSVVVMCWGFIH